MQFSYVNGATYTGPYEEDKFAEAVKDPNVVKACVYRPGEIVTMSDRKYKVGQAGNLVRIRE